MPDIVDDTKDTAGDIAKPAAAYAAGTFVGQQFAGPIGRGGGALLAGSYVGGTMGDTMAAIGAGEAGANLLTAMFAGGGTQASGSTTTEV